MSTHYIIWKARRSPIIPEVALPTVTKSDDMFTDNQGKEWRRECWRGRKIEGRAEQTAQLEKNQGIERSVSVCGVKDSRS